MKTVFVLFGVFAVFGASTANSFGQKLDLDAVVYQQRIFEDVINGTFNKIVSLFSKFDPIDIPHQEIELFGYRAEVVNVNVAGFSNVVATHIKLSGLVTWTLELEIEAPKTAGSVDNWKVDGGLFFGDGDARFEINDFKLKVWAKINPLSIELKDLLITPSIGHADVSITGIYNNEELSKLVSNVLNKFLNDVVNNTELHKRLSKILLTVIQKIIGGILG